MNFEGKITLKLIAKTIAPMILLGIASNSMLLFDRMILGKFSVDQMNAVGVASSVAAVIIFALVSFAHVCEYFVGQLNGDKQYEKAALPVWQVIACLLIASIFVVPIAFFTPDYLIEENALEYGRNYFIIVTSFSCIPAAHAAFSAFFIARGESFIVTFTAILMNVINILLDIIFIFGFELNGQIILEPMGATGAGIATVISSIISLLIVMLVFLNKRHRKKFNSHIVKIDFSMMKKMVKIGVPNSVSHLFEISAWAYAGYLFSSKGFAYVTVNNVATLIFFIVHFINAGIEKGVTAISANLIGAGREFDIKHLINKSVIFYFIITLPTIFFLFNSHIIIDVFDIKDEYVISEIKLAMIYIWLYGIFDGINWILFAVLNSGGDTKFTMTLNSVAVWLCCMLPFYVGIEFFNIAPSTAWLFGFTYVFCLMIFAYRRYKSGKWIKLNLRDQ